MPHVILKQNDLKLADVTIPCAIINSGEDKDPIRVLTEYGITKALFGEASGASKRLKNAAKYDGALLPVFLAPGQLEPFINNSLNDGPILKPIEYVDGKRIITGYDARILPVICDIWLKAREAGALQKQQLDKAQKAEILMRALAHAAMIDSIDANKFNKIEIQTETLPFFIIIFRYK